MTVIFHFTLNSNIWSWEKTFHTTDLNKSIEGYLQNKKLPFDLDISIVRWKIK